MTSTTVAVPPPVRGCACWCTFAAHSDDGGANSWEIRLATVGGSAFCGPILGAYLDLDGWNSYPLDAHKILVMDAGRIIERGNHAALLAANGRYAQMWALQQSAE